LNRWNNKKLSFWKYPSQVLNKLQLYAPHNENALTYQGWPLKTQTWSTFDGNPGWALNLRISKEIIFFVKKNAQSGQHSQLKVFIFYFLLFIIHVNLPRPPSHSVSLKFISNSAV